MLRQLMVIGVVVGWMVVSSRAAEPDAATLIREIRAAEAWLDDVESLRLKFTSKWTRSDEAIGARRAELQKQFSGIEPDPMQFTELLPELSSTIELAFNKQRAWYLNEGWFGPDTRVERIWDGRQAYVHERYQENNGRRQEHYALDRKPHRFLQMIFLDLIWARAAPHSFWWKERQLGEDYLGTPEQYRITGKINWRGIECYVVETPVYGHRHYIGVADHRQYGTMQRAVMNMTPDQVMKILGDLAAEQGKQIKTGEEYYPWLATLPKETQRKLNYEYFRRVEPFMSTVSESWMSDYREVAPGCFMPMKQGYQPWEYPQGGKSYVSGVREMEIVEVSVNKSLPDALFVMQFKEGIEVNDWGHDPPLFYTYKKDRKPEEWQAILDQANQQKADDRQRQAAMNALIGQSAPAFPQTTWMNSKPLSWDDLKGQVVILDFWAEWCGPCRNDLPTMADLHKNRAKNGLTVIGIHNPGSDVKDIESVMKEFDMQYPICIDVASPGGPASWGTLGAQYGVSAIPHSFLVGPDGKIVAHGSLGQVRARARTLIDQSTPATKPAK